MSLTILCQRYYELIEVEPFQNESPLNQLDMDITPPIFDNVNFLCLTPQQKTVYWFYNSCFAKSASDILDAFDQINYDNETLSIEFQHILSIMELIKEDENLNRNTKYYILPNTNIRFMFNNFIPTLLNNQVRGHGFKVKPEKTNFKELPLYVDFDAFYNFALDLYQGKIEGCKVPPKDNINTAIAITGTACLGKSTTLGLLQEKYGIKLLKSSVRGGIKNKDYSIFNASNFQLGVICDMILNPFCMYDRCFLDNMLWRIIMAMFNMDITDGIKFAIASLASLNPTIYEFCRQIPLYILVTNNPQRTRNMMIQRNSCSDVKRALLENYVEYQNIVYGLFTKFANIPLYTNDDLEFVGKCIENNILSRSIQMNYGNVNETYKIKNEYQSVNDEADHKYYKVAEVVRILK